MSVDESFSVTVRPAVSSDLDAVVALFDPYRVFQGQTSDPAAAREFLRARFERGDSTVFVAFLGIAPVGFAQLYPSYSSVSLARVFILNDLFVRESARRRGVASRLLDAVERHAWSLGAVRLSLNVANDNENGQALYRAQGWSRDRQFQAYHRRPETPQESAAR